MMSKYKLLIPFKIVGLRITNSKIVDLQNSSFTNCDVVIDGVDSLSISGVTVRYSRVVPLMQKLGNILNNSKLSRSEKLEIVKIFNSAIEDLKQKGSSSKVTPNYLKDIFTKLVGAAAGKVVYEIIEMIIKSAIPGA